LVNRELKLPVPPLRLAGGAVTGTTDRPQAIGRCQLRT
jgi:hypothetical protein